MIRTNISRGPNKCGQVDGRRMVLAKVQPLYSAMKLADRRGLIFVKVGCSVRLTDTDALIS